MKCRNYCLICLAAVSIFSCGRKPADGGPVVFDVESAADAGKFSGIDTDRLFDVAGWTAIQTADSVVMGNIGIHGYDDGILYGADQYGIWVIRESDGAVLRHIDKTGNGPGEYVSFAALSVDNSRDLLLVYDMFKSEVLAYSFDGTFRPEASKDSTGAIYPMGDGRLMATLPGFTDDEYCFRIYDTSWNLVRESTVRANRKESAYFSGTPPLFTGRGECIYRPFRNDTLYCVKRNEDVPSFVFDNGKYTAPDEFYTHSISGSADSYITGSSDRIIGDMIFHSFRLEDKAYHQIWDTGTGKLLYQEVSAPDNPSSGLPFTVRGAQICFWPAYVFGNDVFIVLGYRDALRLVPGLQEDDNPVVLHLRYMES